MVTRTCGCWLDDRMGILLALVMDHRDASRANTRFGPFRDRVTCIPRCPDTAGGGWEPRGAAPNDGTQNPFDRVDRVFNCEGLGLTPFAGQSDHAAWAPLWWWTLQASYSAGVR